MVVVRKKNLCVDLSSAVCVGGNENDLTSTNMRNLLQIVMDINRNPWRLMLFLLFICSSLNSHVSNGANTITANQSLSGDQTIVSAGGFFEFGFFKPGNSSNYYLGMWYKKVTEQTVVWVANRDKPISDRFSSVLRFSYGNLVLFDESQIPIWSTNLNSTNISSSIEAVLLDEGNLVLRHLSNMNSSKFLWESFDNPTHAWLPGMKIGFNKLTKEKKRLTSWKNIEDPAPGLFSLELDPDGSDQYVMIWNASEIYWRTGIWSGQTYKMVPEMAYFKYTDMYNVSFISDENEQSFVYFVKDPSFISRFILDASGQVRQMYWLETSRSWFQIWSTPRQPCDIYNYCGAFGSCSTEQAQHFCSCLRGFRPSLERNWNTLEDYSSGCVRKTQLQCENRSVTNDKSDRFLANTGMALPKHSQSVAVRNFMECKTSCLNDCSCTAYAYEDNACTVWIGNLMNLQQLAEGDTNGKTIYIKLAASEFPSPKSKEKIAIGVIMGSVALLAFIVLVVIVHLRRRKRIMDMTKAVEGSLVSFSYKDLQKATKNFTEKLGGGGFGSVFKGVLPNSCAIAVKKLESINQGEKQFRTEVSTIGNIQHVNLIQLCGFCSEGNRKLLVYDYMPNGSLDAHLFHNKMDLKVLDWKTRYNIALGAARGLAYLHEKCRDYIIHCDIKPENILLDAEFCPKVADFGLAKLLGREFSRVLTTIRGTRGYLAPEWISGVPITLKADVYSYGMMLFELVSGRRNSEKSEDGEVDFFPFRAASRITEGGDVAGLLDPRLEGNADVELLSRICRVACWCIQDDESNRPSMGQVVRILEGAVDVSRPPVPRFLGIFADNPEYIIFTETS